MREFFERENTFFKRFKQGLWKTAPEERVIYLSDSYVAERLHAAGGDVEVTVAELLTLDNRSDNIAVYPILSSQAAPPEESYYGGWTVANSIKLAQHVKRVKASATVPGSAAYFIRTR